MNAPGMTQDDERFAQSPLLDGSAARELERINKQVRTFVAEKPLIAVLMALTAGYVAGRLISRLS